MKNTIATLLVAVSTIAVAANANAETSFQPYVGVDYNYNNGDNNYNSGTINVGTQFNEYFGTEVFYQQSDDDVNTASIGGKETTSFKAYGLDLMGYAPMGCEQEFSLIGTVGIGEYTLDRSYNWNGAENSDDHGIGYRAGVGALYNIDENVAVRAMARYVKLNKIDDFDHMMEYTAGVRYNF